VDHKPIWQYDELKHHGVDYADYHIAAHYDENHKRFRDYKKNAEAIITDLGLRREHSVIDMGCGTGAFALYAAPYVRKVFAIDVSPAMLDFLKKKAEYSNLTNIECHHAGFLTYNHNDEPVDAIVSITALHHLPDFWKFIGLKRIADMLKPSGRLCLFDVVYPSMTYGYGNAFDRWIAASKEHLGKEFADEIVTHIRDEYSTFDWVIEGMLNRAGFFIDDRKLIEHSFGTSYLCTKN
jgi:cyclopropane fatty-acyl-phospholipid synthase-like methyltransferase